MAGERSRALQSRVRAAQQALEAAGRECPPELFTVAPSPEEWSVAEIVAHVGSSPSYYAGELRRLRRERGGPFGRQHDDPGRLDPIAAHRNDPPEVALPRARASVDEVCKALEELGDDLDHVGVHPRAGEFTLEGLVDRFIVGHLGDHTNQIRETIAALERGS